MKVFVLSELCLITYVKYQIDVSSTYAHSIQNMSPNYTRHLENI